VRYPSLLHEIWRLIRVFSVGSLPFSLLIWHADARTSPLVTFMLVQYGVFYLVTPLSLLSNLQPFEFHIQLSASTYFSYNSYFSYMSHLSYISYLSDNSYPSSIAEICSSDDLSAMSEDGTGSV
jgi:hypothetical protein